MKLSSKIVTGFVLTNVIYILLLAAVFVVVRPVATGSDELVRFVVPVFKNSSDIRYQAAEQRAAMRAFLASPTNDRKIFDQLLAANKAVEGSVSAIDKVFSDPEAAFLQTPALAEGYRKLITSSRQYTELALATPERQDRTLKARGEWMASYEDAVKVLTEALAVEDAALENETRAGDNMAAIRRGIMRIERLNRILDSFSAGTMVFVQGLLGQSQDLYEQSLTRLAETDKMLTAFIGETSEPALKKALERTHEVMMTEYGPRLKGIVSLLLENADITARRNVLSEEVMKEAGNLSDSVAQTTIRFAETMSAAVTEIVAVMSAGSVLTLILSLIMAVILTRSITGPINMIIKALSASAHEVEEAAAHLTSTSGTLANGATENAASLEETSAALEELTSMTQRNADNAVEASGLMTQANEAVTKAETSMNMVIKAMDEISVSGNEIGKIIKTIDEIAFQTNLLALNAAVEAARAGEAGAGFAVVADEVRNLAIRSADAAKSTADLIASTIANINSGSEMVNATAENFKTVEDRAIKVSDLVSEVAEASKEQSQGIGQITTAMSEMEKVTQSNATSAEESAGAAGQLSLQAGSLLGTVKDLDALAHGAGTEAGAAPKPVVKGRTDAAGKALPMAGDDNFDF